MTVLIEIHDNPDDPEVTSHAGEEVIVVNYQQAACEARYTKAKTAELASSALPIMEVRRVVNTIMEYWRPE